MPCTQPRGAYGLPNEPSRGANMEGTRDWQLDSGVERLWASNVPQDP